MIKNGIDIENCLVSPGAIVCIGNINDKKGYQKVKIKKEYIEQALKLLEEYRPIDDDEALTLFIKDDSILQIGLDNIGVIIAPVVNDKKKDKK